MWKEAIIACGVGAGVLGFSQVEAQVFPQEAEWIPVERSNIVIVDDINDTVDRIDIVGDETSPAAFLFSDNTFLFFRIRLNDDPCRWVRGSCEIGREGVRVIIDTDRDDDAYEALVSVANKKIILEQNTEQRESGDPRDKAEVTLQSYSPTEHLNVHKADSFFSKDKDFFVSWAVPWSDLRKIPLSLSPEPLLRFVFGSVEKHRLDGDLAGSANAESIADFVSDFYRCDDAGCTREIPQEEMGEDGDNDGSDETEQPQTDEPTGDADGDGLPNDNEDDLGTSPLNEDTDQDGPDDFTETDGGSPTDTDGDGVIDALDIDSDNDGIGDQIEAGAEPDNPSDSDDDGIANYRDTDSDGDGISDEEERLIGTDPTEPDSEGGGTSGGVEDEGPITGGCSLILNP